MEKLIIADTTSLVNNGELYGHGAEVAKNMQSVLSNDFDVIIAGSKYYKKLGLKLKSLPFHVNKGKECGLIVKMKCILNAVIALRMDAEVIIFQNQYITPVYWAIQHTKKNKRVYIIQYTDPINTGKRKNEGKLYLKIRDKIDGIITSSRSIGKKSGCRYFILPDYMPLNGILQVVRSAKTTPYDFCIVGTVSSKKKYEMVASAIKDTPYKCIIAGKFDDKSRLERIQELAPNNITIIDSYISIEQYYNILRHSKFAILPYDQQHYACQSSGVVMEALYSGTPVIAPAIAPFQFVEEEKLGILYKHDIAEVLSGYNLEKDYTNDIYNYVEALEQKKYEFIKFLRSGK